MTNEGNLKGKITNWSWVISVADKVVSINNEDVYKRLNEKKGKPQIELWLQAGLAQQRA